jgi:hypothetical protein
VLQTDANGMTQLQGYRGAYVLSKAGERAQYTLEKDEDIAVHTIKLN